MVVRVALVEVFQAAMVATVVLAPSQPLAAVAGLVTVGAMPVMWPVAVPVVPAVVQPRTIR